MPLPFLAAKGAALLGGAIKRTVGAARSRIVAAAQNPTIRGAAGGAISTFGAQAIGSRLGPARPGVAPDPFAGGSRSTARMLGAAPDGKKRRRMNPANIHALRRGIRRVRAFRDLAERTVKLIGAAPRRRGRR